MKGVSAGSQASWTEFKPSFAKRGATQAPRGCHSRIRAGSGLSKSISSQKLWAPRFRQKVAGFGGMAKKNWQNRTKRAEKAENVSGELMTALQTWGTRGFHVGNEMSTGRFTKG
jgi:hypothetical protein